MLVPYYFNYYSFVKYLKSGSLSPLIYLSQDSFVYSVFLVISYDCRIVINVPVKNWVLMGLALNLQIIWASMGILTILYLVIHEHGMYLHLS